MVSRESARNIDQVKDSGELRLHKVTSGRIGGCEISTASELPHGRSKMRPICDGKGLVFQCIGYEAWRGSGVQVENKEPL